MSQQTMPTDATIWLQALRTCQLDDFAYGDDTMYATEEQFLLEDLETYGVTLEDIGSSQEEIDQLIRHKAIASAELHLKLIRTWYNPQRENEEAMRSDLLRAGLTLEDIGTSEEELQQLQRKRDVNEAGYYLDRLREGNPFFKVDLALMIECGKVNPTEIESTAQEIAALTV